MGTTFWVIYAIVGVGLVALFIYSKKRTSWDIQPCPFDVLRESETGDSILVSDNGTERSFELIFSFDYDDASKRCYVLKRPEEDGPKKCYVFWRENPDGTFNCTLDDELRRTVQKVFNGTVRFKK